MTTTPINSKENNRHLDLLENLTMKKKFRAKQKQIYTEKERMNEWTKEKKTKAQKYVFYIYNETLSHWLPIHAPQSENV